MQFKYDSLDRMVESINPSKIAKKFKYDALGNVTKVEDEAGNITNYTYSQKSELIEVIDATLNKTTYDYDSVGNMTRINQYELVDKDLGEIERLNSEYRLAQFTTYNLDDQGRLIGLTDALGKIESYEYDINGNVIDRIDKDGYSTKYRYNAVDNLDTILYSDGKKVELTYNSIKQLIAVKDWLGTTTIDIDALGRTLSVTDYNDEKVSYTWGKMGEKKSITYPDSHLVNYNYDKSLNLISMEENHNKVQYVYDEIGHLIERVLPNETKTKYTYNELNRITSLENISFNKVLDSYKFSYDVAGNKNYVEKNRQGIDEDNGIFNYKYDALNRLISVKRDEGVLREYSYDSFGNRAVMKENSKTVNYRYNELNQLIHMNDGLETTDYTYDKRGNMLEMFKQGKLHTNYEFGADNKLKMSTQINGSQTQYIHNGMGWRVGQSVYSNHDKINEIQYILDYTRTSSNILQKKENEKTEEYIWDKHLVKSYSDIHTNYHLQDEMGSNIRLLESNGELIDSYGFDEFGVPLIEEKNNRQTFGFTGYMHEKESELYFANARYYNPSHGRFISEDNVKGFIKSPKTLNVYTYAFNSPMNYVDMNGAWPDLSEAWNGVCETTEKIGTDVWNGVSGAAEKVADDTSYVWNNYIYGEDVTTATNITTPKNGVVGVYTSSTISKTEHTGGNIIVTKTDITTDPTTGKVKTNVGIQLNAEIVTLFGSMGDSGIKASASADIFGVKPRVDTRISLDAENWITEEIKGSVGYKDNTYGFGERFGISPNSSVDGFVFNSSKDAQGVTSTNEYGAYVKTAPVYVVALVAAAIFIAADDITGVGVFDDGALPVIAAFIAKLTAQMGGACLAK